MKQFSIILIAILVNSFSSKASTEEYVYSELFEEGKSWDIIDTYYNSLTKETTIVNKKASVNIKWSDGAHLLTQIKSFTPETNKTYTMSYLEENNIIYTNYEGRYLPIIDFNLHKGDRIRINDGIEREEFSRYCYVVNEEIIDIKGINRRILSIGSEENGSPFTYWIEGIGSIHDWIMLEDPMPTCLETYLQRRRISACYLNNDCIFNYEDFENYISRSGIEHNQANNKKEFKLSFENNCIKVTQSTEHVIINIYSLDGILLLSVSDIVNNTISTTSLPSGCYLANAILEDGSHKNLKFIKK